MILGGNIFMKNIYEILKSIGLEVPEDKKEAFDKALFENYKTISEYEGITGKLSKAESERDTYKTKYDTDIKQRDEDLETLKKQLSDAGVDKTKLDELTNKLSTLQTTYETAKTDYEKQLAAQKYEFLVKESVNKIEFSSNSAKKTFIADVLAKNLPVENDSLLGFDDFVNVYKEQDAGAFKVVENNNSDTNTDSKPKPTFINASNNAPTTSSDNNSNTNQTTKPNPIIW